MDTWQVTYIQRGMHETVEVQAKTVLSAIESVDCQVSQIVKIEMIIAINK